jgi:glycosyltransferase involved in cell wall biosynthesis
MNGLKEFGPFEVHTWELMQAGTGLKKIKRGLEVIGRLRQLKKEIISLQPDLIIAERVTSYGFLGSLFYRYAPIVIAQQGITDIYPPGTFSSYIKKIMQRFAFKHVSILHAWGEIMTYHMIRYQADINKIMILAKGIDMRKYVFTSHNPSEKIKAIVTRSLTKDYRHETILKAFERIKQQLIPFELVIVGDGPLKKELMQSAKNKNIQHEVIFAGLIPNSELPGYLKTADLYLSMPSTEGVSASLLEAMAAGCFPIVSDLPGNRAWITENINGKLVPVDDVDKLVSALTWYHQNRKGLESILIKNRELVEQKASYEKNMKIICDAYVKLIETKNYVRDSRSH